MDIQNIKKEIDIHDIDIKVSTSKFENTNEKIIGIYSIKQEVNNDLNAVKIFDNHVDLANETKRNIFSTHIKNKLGYLKVDPGKGTKSKD
ncbi:uncharacterized protein LOC130448001 isoform X3 [Diorhabda sublineata]|uniref:uncharacterized protein LOC130448001 isoform X3 n=1 Tax=Diorhabda sublineata TaxID=1163346 RepID=UPI0024E0729C|nr:uncharacterized protein LOC130448001 isoform X3 [Diorhabda sublineata]